MADTTLADVLDDAFDALERGDPESARKALEDARRQAPGSRDVALLELEVLEAEGLGEEAVAAAEEALENFKDDIVVKYTAATLMLDIYDDVTVARPILEEIQAALKKGQKPTLFGGDDDDDDGARAFEVDFLLTLADVRTQDLDPRGAVEASQAAVNLDKDDPISRVSLAAGQLDLHLFDEAERTVAKAIDLDDRCAEAFWLRGRLLTARGDHESADRAFARAVRIDPDRFSAPVRMSEDDFLKVMEECVAELPEAVKAHMKNVVISVEDLPPLDKLKESDPPLSPCCLGLWDGTPPSLASVESTTDHFPRHVMLFRKNLEVAVRDEEELREEIAITLLHELGHALGLDEDDLYERGLD